MKYNNFEEAIEDEATNPSSYVCDDCEGLTHNGICGMWVYWGSREVWRPCRTCEGTGVLSLREVGEV